MKKRIWIVLVIAWIIICHSNFVNNAVGLKIRDGYNSSKTALKSGNTIYACENLENDAYIYKMDTEGKVSRIFVLSTYSAGADISDILLDGEYLYALIRDNAVFDINESERCYNIIKLDNNLRIMSEYKWMIPDKKEYGVTVTASEEKLYLNLLTSDRKEAYVYSIPKSSLIEYEGAEEIREVVGITSSNFTVAPEGYRYTYAYFDGSNMGVMLNGHGMNEDLIFGQREEANNIFNSRQFNPIQIVKMNMAKFIKTMMMMFGGTLLIISLFCVFRPKNRLLFWILIWELTLVFVYAMSSNVLRSFTDEQHKNDYKYYADYVLQLISSQIGLADMDGQYDPDYYLTQDYRDKSNNLYEVGTNEKARIKFDGIAIISAEDDKILMASNGSEGFKSSFVYGQEVSDFIKKTYKKKESDIMGVYWDGQYQYVVANRNNNDTMIVGILNADAFSNGNMEMSKVINLLCVFLFLISTFVGIGILVWQSRDLHEFGDSLEKISMGKNKPIKKPKYVGEDIGDMWSGLMDINRNMKNLNYISYAVFEAFYRFAPKSMERVLEKKSINDVESGDFTVKRGTIATIEINNSFENVDLNNINEIIDDRLNLKREKHLLTLISDYQESGRGFQVSFDASLSDLTMLFPEGNRRTCEFGREFFIIQSENKEDKDFPGSVFLHYDKYAYGVVGEGNQYMQYLVSEGDDLRVEVLIYVMRALKLRLVISEDVYVRELNIPKCRYIGYVHRTKNNKNVNLYEVLDVCTDVDTKRKLETDSMLQEAIGMFMEGNFYQARNQFAQILKINPGDTVARWYVFTCERYLESDIKDCVFSLNQK